MIRKRKPTRAQLEARAYKQSAPIGIGEGIDEQRERESAEEARIIKEVRAQIWATRQSCQLCHGARRKEYWTPADQMHEDPSRAQTRGRPPKERFNTRVCGRVCDACHRDVTEHKIWIRFADTTLRFEGPVYAVRQEDRQVPDQDR